MTDVARNPRLDLRAATIAGLIAGLVFLMMEMGLVAATTGSPWGPPRMIAAMALGQDVLPPPASFDLMVLIMAMMIHFVFAIVLGLVWAVLAGKLSGAVALIAGAVFGLVIYAVSFYGMTGVFPWFAMARGWIAIVSHIAFGLILAATYLKLRRPATFDARQ